MNDRATRLVKKIFRECGEFGHSIEKDPYVEARMADIIEESEKRNFDRIGAIARKRLKTLAGDFFYEMDAEILRAEAKALESVIVGLGEILDEANKTERLRKTE